MCESVIDFSSLDTSNEEPDQRQKHHARLKDFMAVLRRDLAAQGKSIVDGKCNPAPWRVAMHCWKAGAVLLWPPVCCERELTLACRAVVARACPCAAARAPTVVAVLTSPNAAIAISKFLFMAFSFK